MSTTAGVRAGIVAGLAPFLGPLGFTGYSKARRTLPFKDPLPVYIVENTLDQFDVLFSGGIVDGHPAPWYGQFGGMSGVNSPNEYLIYLLFALPEINLSQAQLDALTDSRDAANDALKNYFRSINGQGTGDFDANTGLTQKIAPVRILTPRTGSTMEYNGQQFYGSEVLISVYEQNVQGT